jgi:plastocyanin
MSILGRRVSGKMVAAAAAVFIVAAGLLPVMTTPRAREIRLVAREMAFYTDRDDTTANPIIEAAPGEMLRVVLVNQDRGITHDFAVPAFAVATDAIDWNERDEVTFKAPAKAGTYEYVCRPHAAMMKGRIVVRSGD